MARQSRRYSNKCAKVECFKKATGGRNPENHSIWRERDNRSYRHNFQDTYYDVPETADGGIAETSPFTQVLQVRNSKTKNMMKCPPVISSCKIPRSYWEDKPMLVMKIIKGKRSRQCKDTPPNSSLLSSFSTERELPVVSGLLSEENRFQDRHQSEGRETNAANEMENSSETAETNQTSAKENEDKNICGATIQLLQTEQKAAGEQRTEKDANAHGDSGTCDQPEDKNQEVIFINSISERERCNRELQKKETRYTKIIHHLGEAIKTWGVKKRNFESRDQQLMEGKQQLPNDCDSSREKVLQLDEAKTKMASYKTSVIQLQEKKREQTEQTQCSVPSDLLQQTENITEKGETQVQLHQLLQGKSQMEDVRGQEKKWNKWFSLFFSKAAKMEKERNAEIETETNMTGEAGERKSRKWFLQIFFGKALKMEKDAKVEETNMTEEPGEGKSKKWFLRIFFGKALKTEKEEKVEETNLTGEAGEGKRRSCFINMFQRTYSSMKKKTQVTF